MIDDFHKKMLKRKHTKHFKRHLKDAFEETDFELGDSWWFRSQDFIGLMEPDGVRIFRHVGEVDFIPKDEMRSREPCRFNGYTLYKREVELSNDAVQEIYFFSKNNPKRGEPCPLPEGYDVGVNKYTGLPYVKKTEEYDG